VLAGRTQVGTVGDTAFAAASGQRSASVSVVVVVTRERGEVLGQASRWFLLASGATVLLAALVAVVLGRRLVRPVVQAAQATHRIADGDLSARLPAPPDRHADELAELTRSVNAMAEALERSRGLEQQFLLSVSHDLRTPLTSIRGYAEAIQDGAVEPLRASETILDQSRRLQRLVQDLLDLARLDARSFSLRAEPVDVRSTAVAVVESLQAEAVATGVRLGAVLPPSGAGADTTIVQADQDRLAQVVANLVENALRFAREQVRVEVAESVLGAAVAVELSVHDDGDGIAAEDLPHVFERLYVAKHRPERKEAGSGLGLAIARDLTRAMGGEITVDSQPGTGTRFSVVLPTRVSRPPSPP